MSFVLVGSSQERMSHATVAHCTPQDAQLFGCKLVAAPRAVTVRWLRVYAETEYRM